MNPVTLLIEGHEAWRVGTVCDGQPRAFKLVCEQEPTLREQVAALREYLTQHDAQGPVVLAVGSAQCLSAAISTQDLGRSARRRAMHFQLEEHLPTSTEQVVADYIEHSGDMALGICSEIQPLQEIVEALEEADIEVAGICPTAVLIAGHAAAVQPHAAGLCIISSAGFDLIALRDARPAAWWWFPPADEAGWRQLRSWSTAQADGRELLVIDDNQTPLEEVPGVTIRQLDQLTVDEAATLHAGPMLLGKSDATVNLRCDALAAASGYEKYRRTFNLLVAAVAIMLLCTAGVSHWRAAGYRHLGDQYVQQQVEVFRSVMPEQRLPGSIQRRLASEHEKLRGLDEANSADGGAEGPSALVQLYRVLDHLPEDLRYRLLEMSIEPRVLRISGEARNYADAERIALSLRDDTLYDVQLPQTQALREDGVTFSFTAEPRPSSRSTGSEP
ncbi:MAG: hypothetical protein WD294_09330 [Phycisphaeraceae bacterium]